MQNNKRKNRGGSVRAPRARSIVAEGVYNNAHFMHAATSQVGNVVRIQTASGSVWEGVFKTFSSNFDVVIEVAAKVDNPDSPNSQIQADSCVDKLIFKACDILTMVAKDIDLEYPTRDTFQTDTAISARLNGASKLEERELEPWDPTGGSAVTSNGLDSSLDLDPASNGWDADDMFRTNEQEYGVQTTFDHTLRQYTVPLVRRADSADYREAEARAEAIAMEIENQPQSRARAELEDGDEEAAFAAVTRPPREQDQASTNGKYIPPSKRKNQNIGKLVRSTPPPAPSQSSSSSQNTPSPKDTRPPMTYPTAHASPHQNNVHVPSVTQNQQHPHQAPQHQQQQPSPHVHNHIVQSSTVVVQQSPQQPPQVVQQHALPPQQVVAAPSQPLQQQQQPQQPPQQQQSSHPVPNHHGHGRPHHAHTPPHHHQQYQPSPAQIRQQHSNKPQMNGEGKGAPNGPPQRMHRYGNQQQYTRGGGGGMSEPPVVATGPSPPQHTEQKPPREEQQQRHHHHQHHHHQQQQQIQHHTNRGEDNVVKELHAFAQDFKLAPMQQQQGGAPPQQVQQVVETPPAQVQQPVADPGLPQQPPSLVQQQNNSAPPPPAVHPSNSNKPPVVPTMPSAGGPRQTTSPPHPQQALSPQQQQQQDPNVEKVVNTLKNSKLNPNAKEFVLNPAAKPFQPRSPSTPSASRPHTPQTPSHSPYIPASVSGPGVVQPQMPVMMPLYHVMTSQPQYQPPPQPQQNRMKRLPMGGMRTDMASQMQVAAATGQPLLAPAPLQQFIYPPSAAVAMNQAAAAISAAYQPVHHAVRMYEAAAAAGGPPPHQHQPPPQATQIQYLPHQPPHQSQTPSPAQHQQQPPPQYNPAAQGGPPQQQQGPPHHQQQQQQQQCAAAPPPQVDTTNFYGHHQFPLMYPLIPAQAHMMQGMQYLQQAPPPPPQQHPQHHHHAQHPMPILMHQHPAQAHGPNP